MDLNLVGGAITPLKNDGVRQWVLDDIPYMTWKIIQMFETTNQLWMFMRGWMCSIYPSASPHKYVSCEPYLLHNAIDGVFLPRSPVP